MKHNTIITVTLTALILAGTTTLHGEDSGDIIISPPPPPLDTFDLPSFSVTTADVEPHFLKMTISLGYEESVQIRQELAERKNAIIHTINILLSGKKYEDLDSIEDTIALVEEIKASVNIVLKSGKISDVYLKEYILN